MLIGIGGRRHYPIWFGTAPAAPAHRLRRYVTRSRRGFGLDSRPTFAHGLPSTSTTSAVKSFDPRSNDDPTPYESTGTPIRSNSRMRAAVKPPDTTIFTRS